MLHFSHVRRTSISPPILFLGPITSPRSSFWCINSIFACIGSPLFKSKKLLSLGFLFCFPCYPLRFVIRYPFRFSLIGNFVCSYRWWSCLSRISGPCLSLKISEQKLWFSQVNFDNRSPTYWFLYCVIKLEFDWAKFSYFNYLSILVEPVRSYPFPAAKFLSFCTFSQQPNNFSAIADGNCFVLFWEVSKIWEFFVFGPKKTQSTRQSRNQCPTRAAEGPS